uniref:Uncharacterized protein n=1 Tax=Rhizophora mucronata TaxID=61149 RepID=A0A2P2K0K8_RHIMU
MGKIHSSKVSLVSKKLRNIVQFAI